MAQSEYTMRMTSTSRFKPSESHGLESRYESLLKSCSQNLKKSDTLRELTKTTYGSSYWRNWNATRPEISVKISKLSNLQDDFKNKERNYKLHHEETQGRAYDEDYFVPEVKGEIENLDRWYYDHKHFMGKPR